MKRIHLFEFEDFAWFPNWLRDCGTHYLVTLHRLFGTAPELAKLIDKGLKESKQNSIIDLCSGGTGPMLDVLKILETDYQHQNLQLRFSDLYPNLKTAARINSMGKENVSFITTPIDATQVPKEQKGLRTMVCSLHHMRPKLARAILTNAKEAQQPICIFEISDNSAPIWLWWTAIPFAFLMVFFITPFVRPLSWQQIVFTYLIPLIPLFIAWDGAASNARTYTLKDMDILLEGLESENYHWEKGVIKGKAKKLFLLGIPK